MATPKQQVVNLLRLIAKKRSFFLDTIQAGVQRTIKELTWQARTQE